MKGREDGGWKVRKWGILESAKVKDGRRRAVGESMKLGNGRCELQDGRQKEQKERSGLRV